MEFTCKSNLNVVVSLTSTFHGHFCCKYFNKVNSQVLFFLTSHAVLYFTMENFLWYGILCWFFATTTQYQIFFLFLVMVKQVQNYVNFSAACNSIYYLMDKFSPKIGLTNYVEKWKSLWKKKPLYKSVQILLYWKITKDTTDPLKTILTTSCIWFVLNIFEAQMRKKAIRYIHCWSNTT